MELMSRKLGHEKSSKKVVVKKVITPAIVYHFVSLLLLCCQVEAALFQFNNQQLQAPASEQTTTFEEASFATFQSSQQEKPQQASSKRLSNTASTGQTIFKNDKKLFVVELLKMLHEQYAPDKELVDDSSKVPSDYQDSSAESKETTGNGAIPTANKKEDRVITVTPSTRQQVIMNQLLNAINADGDIKRLIDWVQNSFNLASVGELTTQFVVSKLGSVNCAALLKPDKEETLVPRFLLFNEHFVDVPYELTINPTATECLSHGKFDPVKKTLVIIHGYLAGYTLVDGLTNIKNRVLDLNKIVQDRATRVFVEASQNNGTYVLTDDLELLVRQQQYNVVIVDWFNGANPVPRSRYIRAAVNAQVVGQLIARFLSALVVQCKTPANYIQIIAHSLGCHVAGFTGKAMRSAGHRLGKITHLDPIGLCFGRLFSEPRFRLSPSDALDTQAVHVSLNIFDNPLDGAQSNFLVNGGRDQIGCGGQSELKNSTSSSVSLLWDSEAKFVPCSHVRALSLFEDDLSSKPNQCQIVGYRCLNYERFLAGKCGKCDNQNNQCRLMGFPPLFSNFNKLTIQRPISSTNNPQVNAVQGEYNDTEPASAGYSQNQTNEANKIVQGTKLISLVNQISNGSIAWIVDDKELNQKIGSTIAKLKPDFVLAEKEDQEAAKQMNNNNNNKEDNNEIRRMDRKLTSDQRERLAQTIDKLKQDTKQALSGGWLNFKNDVDISKYKVGSILKPTTTTGQQQHQNQLNHFGGLLINHLSPTLESDKLSLQASVLSPLTQSISISGPSVDMSVQPTLIHMQDVQPFLETSSAPLGSQALPVGSSNGPLYFVGTGPVSPYCVNYYQFRLLIAESRINRLLSSNSLAPNRLGSDIASNVNKLMAQNDLLTGSVKREPTTNKDKLHMTIKLTDTNGHFFKGFTLVESARYLTKIPIESPKQKFVAASDNMLELTMLLNTTRTEPIRIGEAIISYYFHKIVLADTVEVNYMSNISPE